MGPLERPVGHVCPRDGPRRASGEHEPAGERPRAPGAGLTPPDAASASTDVGRAPTTTPAAALRPTRRARLARAARDTRRDASAPPPRTPLRPPVSHRRPETRPCRPAAEEEEATAAAEERHVALIPRGRPPAARRAEEPAG